MTLTLAALDGQILKRDSAGRVKTPQDRRQAILEEFDRSGMSGQQFAKWAGIKYTTFANWLQQRRKRGQPASSTKTADQVQWVKAVVGGGARRETDHEAGGLIVLGPGGVRIEIHEEKHVDWAAKLLRQLDGTGPC